MTPARMLAAFQDPQNVTVSFEEMEKVSRWSLEPHIGSRPNNRQTAVLMSKTGLECNRWGRDGHGLWNYNFGNIKAAPTYGGKFTLYRCNEVLKDRGVVWFDPEGELSGKGGVIVGPRYALPPTGDGHPQCRFRAYANAFDGANQYVEFIATGRYEGAFDEMLEGDVAGYVHALKLKGYFTADETVYRRGVEALFNEIYKKLEGEKDVDECALPDYDDIQSCLAPQRHNAEATAMAMGMAIDSLYDNLESLRRDANRQMATIQDDDGPSFDPREADTKNDPPGQA